MSKIIRSASAGGVESGDCFVQIEPGKNGVELELQSTLILQFGDRIRETVLKTLEESDISDAKLTLDDHGALDWILKARVQTAIERAKEETV